MMNDKGININSVKARCGIGLSAIVYLIYTVYNISGYSSEHHNYVIITLLAVWIFFAWIEDVHSFHKAIHNSTVSCIAFFLVYYFIMSMFYGNIVNTMKYIAKYIILFSCILQFRYYYEKNNVSEFKLLTIGALITWMFFAGKAILFYLAHPSAARTLASDFYAFGNIALGGGYAIAFGSSLLCVYLFERVINQNNKKKFLKPLFILMILVLFFLLIKTESTLTFLACVFGVFMSILRRMWRKNGRSNQAKKILVLIALTIVALVILLNFREIGGWIVDITKDGTENTIIRRVNRLGQKMLYSSSSYENYIDERFGCIVQSLKTFLKHPLIGVGFQSGNIFSLLKENGLGMHSALCDLLAQHGLIGGIACIMIFVRALSKECKTDFNTYLAAMLFMCFVNPFEYFHAYFAMFTLIPMIDVLMERANKFKLKRIAFSEPVKK